MLIQQRWGEDDLPGRIIEAPDGGEWQVVRLPAVAEANDPLGRGAGESLWPERGRSVSSSGVAANGLAGVRMRAPRQSGAG